MYWYVYNVIYLYDAQVYNIIIVYLCTYVNDA